MDTTSSAEFIRILESLPEPPPDVIKSIYYHPDDADKIIGLGEVIQSGPLGWMSAIALVESRYMLRGKALVFGKNKTYLVNIV